MLIKQRRVFKGTTLISSGLATCLFGLYVAHFDLMLSGALLLIPPSLLLMKKRGYVALVAVLLVSFMIGWWRGNSIIREVEKYNSLYNSKVVLSGVASADASYDDIRNVTSFDLVQVHKGTAKLPGSVIIRQLGHKQVPRGSEVMVTGTLRAVRGGSRQGSISVAKVKVLRANKSLLEDARSKFFSAVHSALPEPQASIGLGYLVGLKVNIPKEINDELAIVGLSHIVAVSGYNLTILVRMVRRLFAKRSAYQAFVLSALLIVSFVIIAGGSAPIYRAAVVSVLSLLAWYYGREYKPLLLLLLSGAVTAMANPLYVWGDVAWYLSFLAFAGILLLGPLIVQLCYTKRPAGAVGATLIETISAQLCTLPYVLHIFGGASVIAPLANVLILPFVPIVMLTIFLTGFAGIFLPAVATILAISPGAIITLQLWFIKRLSVLPWAYADKQIDTKSMAGFYVVLVVGGMLLHRFVAGRSTSVYTRSDLI